MNEKEAYEMMKQEVEIARLETILDSEYSFQGLLESELRDREEEIDRLELGLSERNEMIVELQEELCEQDNEIAELQTKASHISIFSKIIRFIKKAEDNSEI